MEHIAALLLIIGCSADLKQCVELPSPATVFETAEECQQTLPVSLRDVQGARPRVFATCIPVDPAMEEEDAELTWDITPDGRLVGSVDAVPKVLVNGQPGKAPVVQP